MRTIYSFLFACILLLTMPVHSQIDDPIKTKKIVPKSIYALNYFHQTSSTGFSPFANTKVPSYDVVFFSFDDLENNSSSFDINSFLNSSDGIVYEAYANYDNYPLKGFLRQYDPTRWICPIMPPTW